jgi:peroxiredoxin
LLVSADDVDTLRSFKAQHGPSLRFAADPGGALLARYGVKTPLLTVALRTTFAINTEGRVVAVLGGGDAIEARQALQALYSSPAPASSHSAPAVP